MQTQTVTYGQKVGTWLQKALALMDLDKIQALIDPIFFSSE